MKDQFIPYELALKLKELGFNEPCFSIFHPVSREVLTYSIKSGGYNKTNKGIENFLLAPLWQQAFDWFTSKGYHSYIEGAYPWFRYYINTEDDRYEGFKHLKLQEARQACLEKLIKLIENDT